MLKLNVFEEFFWQIKKLIIYGKEAFLDIFHRYFPEEISLYSNGKYFIVQSSIIDPCQFILAVLKGKGLKVSFARKLFFGIN